MMNNDYYVFDLGGDPNIQWSKLTSDGIENP